MFKMDVALPVSDQSPRGATKRGAKAGGTRRSRGRRGAGAAVAVPMPPQQQPVSLFASFRTGIARLLT